MESPGFIVLRVDWSDTYPLWYDCVISWRKYGATPLSLTLPPSVCMHVFAGIRTREKDGQNEAVFSKEALEATVAGTHFKLVQLSTCPTCVEQWAILGDGINTESLEVEVCVLYTCHMLLNWAPSEIASERGRIQC